MSDDTTVPENPTNANPIEEPVAAEPVAEQPPVDLVKEAGEAAAIEQSVTGRKIRTLDDLDLDGAVRSQIESYVSKAVNEAVSSHDQRQQKKLDDEGFMNRSQIEQLMEDKDAEYGRREEAKESFLNILGAQGISPGTEDYMKVQNFYRTAVEDGRLTSHILLSEAGIRTLVSMSGVSQGQASAGPQSGLERTSRSVEGVVTYADGAQQLNAGGDGKTLSLDEKVRAAIYESLENPK